MQNGSTAAFVFVNCEIGREEETLNRIRMYGGVRNVHSLYGVYSAVLEVDFNCNRDVLNQILKTPCIYSMAIVPIKNSFQ